MMESHATLGHCCHHNVSVACGRLSCPSISTLGQKVAIVLGLSCWLFFLGGSLFLLSSSYFFFVFLLLLVFLAFLLFLVALVLGPCFSCCFFGEGALGGLCWAIVLGLSCWLFFWGGVSCCDCHGQPTSKRLVQAACRVNQKLSRAFMRTLANEVRRTLRTHIQKPP